MKMAKKTRRIVAIILVLAIAITLVPTQAFAASSIASGVVNAGKQLQAVIDKPDIQLTEKKLESGKSYYVKQKTANGYNALEYSDGKIVSRVFESGKNAQKFIISSVQGIDNTYLVTAKNGDTFDVTKNGIVKGTEKQYVNLFGDADGNVYFSPVDHPTLYLTVTDKGVSFQPLTKKNLISAQFRVARSGYVATMAVNWAKEHTENDKKTVEEKNKKVKIDLTRNTSGGASYCTNKWKCCSYVSKAIINGNYKMKMYSAVKDLYAFLDSSKDWEKVSIDKAQVGDVVFYSNKGHVGLVSRVSGSGKTKGVWVTEHNNITFDNRVLKNNSFCFEGYDRNMCFHYIGE